ncbi:MAG: SURF1 family protein [Devosia sp.]
MATPFRRTAAGRALLAVLVVASLGILIALGTWQVQRLHWKEALIAAAAERPTAAAIDAPGPSTWPDFHIEDWNYRKVRLTGRFGEGEAHTWIALSDPKGALGGPGYFVVAPFTTEDGWNVLINRGFVPDAQKDPGAREGSDPPQGRVTIEGLVRRDDIPNIFTPDPDLETNIWFARHRQTMAPYLGLSLDETAPYSVDLIAKETPLGGLPQAGESRITFTNNHLSYALTWYGLAGCLVAVLLAAWWRSGRREETG